MNNQNIATDVISEWQEMKSAPWGYKCFLLTRWGIAVVGVPTRYDPGYVAWAPMPRIPKRIKELMARY